MAMRNFWITGSVAGRKTKIATGPQGSGGGFSLTVYQNDGGKSIAAVRVRGWVMENGELVVEAYPADITPKAVGGDGAFQTVTQR